MQGNLLVDNSGAPVVLHGVNRSGTEYACIQGWGIFDGPSDQASVTAMQGWHLNAVRLPLNEDCWLGINGAPPAFSGATYQQAIRDYVSLLNANGFYAILELHWSAAGSSRATWQVPMPDADHAPAFWSSVAGAFAGNSSVIFELFNEPWPDSQWDTTAAWTCLRDGGTCPGVDFETVGMQALVNVVRSAGATNVIAVGGVSYANSLTHWLDYEPVDPLNNLAAAWHVYSFNICSSTQCYETTAGPVARQVPIISTEIGNAACDSSFMETLMSWLDARRAGYFAHAWDTWGTSCSTFALIADFGGTPTVNGQIYLSHLTGLQ